jgi:hypothetical protein
MTAIIKAGSYCPVCRGMPLSDCHHSMEQIRAAATGSDYWQDKAEKLGRRCSAPEALAVELGANLKAAEIAVDAYGCQTPAGFIADECAALVASIKRALASPLLAELRGKEAAK